MKKKITLDQWTMLGKYNYAQPWLRNLCIYKLSKISDIKYRREQYVGWLVYILAFIPVCIITAGYCLWDGGLKEFELPPRYLGGDDLWECDYGELLKEFYGE